MEGQIFLGIFILRIQHKKGTSLSRKIHLQVPVERLQVPLHGLLSGLHTRGRNKVVLSYTDWSKD